MVLAALLLVLLNGFFVAAEFSLVKLRATRVKAMAKALGWKGRILAKVHSQLDAYLSACQLGITLASLGLGWIGEPAFAELLHPTFEWFGIREESLIHLISFSFAFTVISFLHIVVGELAPKSLAIRRAEQMGLWTAAPLYGFYWAMYPAIQALNLSANCVLKLLKLDGHAGHESHYSSEELKMILRSSQSAEPTEKGAGFTGEEWRVLAHSLDFGQLKVSDLMRPIGEMVALSSEQSASAHLDKMLEYRFSRYPYLDKEGTVKGIIHLKDLFSLLHKRESIDSLESFLRPAQIVNADLPATELFRRFREGKSHFAVVVRHGGRPIGFLSFDNLLGALVGEIRDEFRQSQHDWMKLDDDSLVGKGSLPIFTLERALGIDIQDEVEAEAGTIGGLILWKLGELPQEGQRIAFEAFDAVVKKMNGPRIVMVRIYPHPSELLESLH